MCGCVVVGVMSGVWVCGCGGDVWYMGVWMCCILYAWVVMYVGVLYVVVLRVYSTYI